MWYTPENRFRIVVVRRPSDGELLASRVIDCEKFEKPELLEEELGRETVRLAEKHGAGLEIFEASGGGPRPLLAEWWRGQPKLRFILVRRKTGKRDMPVRKFMDAAKYKNQAQFDKAVGDEKTRLSGLHAPAEWDVMEIGAESMNDFKAKHPDLAK